MFKFKIEVASEDPDAEAYVEGAARDLKERLEFGPHSRDTTQVAAYVTVPERQKLFPLPDPRMA